MITFFFKEYMSKHIVFIAEKANLFAIDALLLKQNEDERRRLEPHFTDNITMGFMNFLLFNF